MDDLVKWLGEQLDEDARVATAATPPGSGHWSLYIEGGDDGWAFEDSKGGEPGCIIGSKAVAQHITCWNPGRVLAEVEAKRAILRLHTDAATHPKSYRHMAGVETLRALALPYRDRPGWQPEWAPER